MSSLRFLSRAGVGLTCLLGATPAFTQAFELNLPISCVLGVSCFIQNYVDRDSSVNARDYECSSRTYDGHNGTDFRLPSMREQRGGVNVLAAAPGIVTAIRDGMEDQYYSKGVSELNGRECGNGVVMSHEGGWTTQYCHLAKGTLRVSRGDKVEAGRVIGQVGLSGMTEFPHLHLTVRQGTTVIDPFSTGDSECGMRRPLWSKSFLGAYSYRAGTLLNSGFADGPVEMRAVEDGAVGAAPTVSSATLFAYFRWMGLEKGDQVHIRLRSPDGSVLAEAAPDPLERPRALELRYLGRKRPSGGWKIGKYEAEAWVSREGKRILEKTISIDF